MTRVLLVLVSFVWGKAPFAAAVIGGPGLANPAVSLDFTEVALTNGTVLDDQYAAFGVTFDGLFYNGCPTCVTARPGGTKPDITNFQDISAYTPLTTVRLSSLSSDISFAWASSSGQFAITALRDGDLVESFDVTVADQSDWQTYGFSEILFDEVRISTPDLLLLDNLRFNTAPLAHTPLPNTLALLCGALAALAFGLRRPGGAT